MVSLARLALLDLLIITLLTLPVLAALHAAMLHALREAEALSTLLLTISILTLATIQPSQWVSKSRITRGKGWYALLILTSMLTLLPLLILLTDALFNTRITQDLLPVEVSTA